MPVLAWSSDPTVRRAASSGGAVKSLLAWLVASGRVEQAVITRMRRPWQAETVATANVEEILNPDTNSVYHLGRVLSAIPAGRTSAVVALPCQVEAIRHAQGRGELRGVQWLIELLCNQIPDRRWRAALARRYGVELDQVVRVRYRGAGWPGWTELATADGRTIRQPFPSVWPHRRYLSRRCRTCRRVRCGGDFVAGDPWYISGEMGDGKTLVWPTHAAAAELLRIAAAAGALVLGPVAAGEAEACLRTHVGCKTSRS